MTQPAPPGPPPIPRDAIKSLLKSLACLEAAWNTEQRPVMGSAGGPQAFMVLTLAGERPKGTNEYRQTYDPVADRIVNEVGGYRIMTINVRVSSLEETTHPLDVLERIRWGLWTVNSEAALTAAGLEYVRMHPSVPYTSKAGTRTMLNASMDIELARVAVAIATQDPGDYIATVDAPGGVPFTGS